MWSRRLRSRENNRKNIVGLYTHHVFFVHFIKHSLFPEPRGWTDDAGSARYIGRSGLIGPVGRIYNTIIEPQLADSFAPIWKMVSSSAQEIKNNDNSVRKKGGK